MARTDAPNVARSEEKKDSPSHRKTWDRKKPASQTVWPCTIDGCDKQFAREADLKRHQRTTKLHSMPSFACPQCHATFTRTDAQRRHQKSRHNGVVIEGDQVSSTSPITPTSAGSDAGPLPPQPEGKRAEDMHAPLPSGSHQPSADGTKKYYREDSAAYTPTLYPVSSHQRPGLGWSPASWKPNDASPYTPSPYYRSSFTRTGTGLPPLSCNSDTSSTSDSPRSTPTSPNAPQEHATYSRAPIQPPISPSDRAHSTPDEVAMLEAIIKYREADAAARRAQAGESSRRHDNAESTSSEDDDLNPIEGMPLEDLLNHDHFDSPVHKPGSLQDILTEDCEPVFSSDVSSRVFESSPLARDT